MAGNVQALLDEEAPVQDSGAADTAIFYSISNAQKGLAGISFGNFLIKRVVDSLASEFKGLKTFATLSPVPGFGAWLDGALGSGDSRLLKSGERKALLAAAGRGKGAKGALKELLARPGWHKDKVIAKALKSPLMRLSARYLVTERPKGERVKDRVAHFHLSNGARMERINWLADTSAKGLASDRRGSWSTTSMTRATSTTTTRPTPPGAESPPRRRCAACYRDHRLGHGTFDCLAEGLWYRRPDPG